MGLLDTIVGLILADAVAVPAVGDPAAATVLRGASRRRSRRRAASTARRTLRAFFSVALPLARNGIFTVTAIVFLVSWGEFLYGDHLHAVADKYPMSALIALQAGAYGIDWPSMMAFAVVSAVPVFLVYIVSYRLLQTGSRWAR